MAFDDARRQYDKEHLWFIEIEVGGTTYRFCENRSPLPAGLNANPSLQRVNVSPAEIDLTGGIGVRARASVTLIESDDYSEWGTVDNPERFWARWRAENPFYFGQRFSVYSGYIVNGAFSEDNFIRRDYIIESFAQTGGGVSLVGKDALKLASNDRAKAPRESRGSLNADMLETDTTLTLAPSGIGDAEYPTANGIIRVEDEVMQYATRTGDVLSGITRGLFNTVAEEHSENDIAQLCLRYDSQTVSDIDYDLLTTYANVDPSFINQAEWQAEASNSFVTTYSVLITEPTGVQELLKEFAQSAPHYLYWDERVNRIRMVALRPPPIDAPVLTWEGNFIEGSTAIQDKQDMRISTVVVNYGIIDPTKDLDEVSNYRATYVREDSDSVANYGQRAYKTVNSRWIPSDNQTAAVLMAARIGRRFSEAPRLLTFSLDAKDAEVWTGDSVRCQTDLILQQGGGIPTLFYQILSAGEGVNYNYTALEHTYGPALPADEDVEDPNVRLVYFSGQLDRLGDDINNNPRTLRQVYEDVFGADPLDANLDIRFIFESNCIAGSSTNGHAIETGAWPELTTPILIQNNGFIAGKGGNATQNVGGIGGPAISLQADIRLNNLNVIGGGGGGGGAAESNDQLDPEAEGLAGGGGGAGFVAGNGANSFGGINPRDGANGTLQTGGNGGSIITALAGNGGNLGQSGQSGQSGDIVYLGGDAGDAINLNGFTITYESTGTILGDIM